ncbi:MAG TPA: YetF domain-containing protein [Flavisolibacter sp.]|jgi:uncharacterized membrane protein YcaP (DUF421 family)|nr:YetF domain-containing protein [Flavisolibacter sp.]
MKKDEIQFTDWQRILFGEVPLDFFFEVVLRTAIIFLLLILSMRLFGKRMSAQINRIEMVALFTLAAAIGVPLQTPDRGLLPAFIIAIVVLLLGRLLARWAFNNERFEARVEDRLAILANDGVLDMQKLKGTVLTKERVFEQLRSEGLRHLGEVKRLYLEANGAFSLVKESHPSYGLSVLPLRDTEFLDEQTHCNEQVCCTCGKKKADNEQREVCSNCKDDQWMNGIM